MTRLVYISSVVKASFLSILGLIFCLGCTERPDYFLPGLNQRQLHNTAPRSQSQTGHLVHGATDQQMIEFTNKHPESRIRPLYPKQGLYEVFTDKPEDLPNATENIFIPKDPISLMDFDDSCDQSNEDLPVEILIEGEKEAFSEITVTIKDQKNLQADLQIQGPRGSLLNVKTKVQSTYSFVPDQGGVFRLFFVIKDPNNRNNQCWQENSALDIQHNPEFNPQAQYSEHVIENFDRSPFWYLERFKSSEDETKKIKVAVIDSGVNYNHPAIAAVIDPDNLGYDFVEADNYPFDPIGHGSHLAGLIASPINGVSKKVQILPIRAFGNFGYDIGSLVAALYYAADNGAQIINLSAGWLGNPESEDFVPLKKAIEYLKTKDIILVVAAGNGDPFNRRGFNISTRTFLPASLAKKSYSQNMIVVAATDENDELATYSNYSTELVDLAALGGTSDKQLLSADMQTASGELWHYRFGTSQATAFVCGALADYLAEKPTPIHSSMLYLWSLPRKDSLTEYVIQGRHLNTALQ